jgi:hypothetical protein
MNTRDANASEARHWINYKARFESKTKPMISALNILRLAGRGMENAVEEITGNTVVVIDEQSNKVINDLYHRMQIMDRQISGVLLKKYYVQFNVRGDNDIDIVAPVADEADIMPAFEGVGILIGIGIAAVTLMAGGFFTMKILDTQAEVESKRIAAKMQQVDANMMKLSPEKRSQWNSWKTKAIEAAKAAAKDIPGAKGLLEKFLGSKGVSLAIGGLIAIAGLYFLIPALRRN